jgi:hypothetical protein
LAGGAAVITERFFFSEEKKQKTFISPQLSLGRYVPDRAASAGIKVFLLLFLQKKKTLGLALL